MSIVGNNNAQVDTAGWLHRTKEEKGPASLSVMQSTKNLMRAHVVALVLDAEEVCDTISLFPFLFIYFMINQAFKSRSFFFFFLFNDFS